MEGGGGRVEGGGVREGVRREVWTEVENVSVLKANPVSCKTASVRLENKGLNVSIPVMSSFW